jgi:hypothetical protein
MPIPEKGAFVNEGRGKDAEINRQTISPGSGATACGLISMEVVT